MTTEEIGRIYDKTLRVIASCQTKAHLEVARKFVDAANNYLSSRTGSEFAAAYKMDLCRKLSGKEAAIMPQVLHFFDQRLAAMAQHPQHMQNDARATALARCGQSTAGNLFGRLF